MSDDKKVKDLSERFIKELKLLTNEQRLDVFGSLGVVFCMECGVIDEKQKCQCWNDE